MKKILFCLIAMFVVTGVFGQSDTTDLNTYINSNFPDNTSGFITPERLRNVAKEIMRSSANLLERNAFAEPVQVDDTIKSTVGFFSWDGANWVEVGDLSDTAVWARSGGFILPLEYSDKLSVGTARIGDLIYPNDATVNIGTNSVSFDTIFVNTISGLAAPTDHNTLDEAYDQGGVGNGRTITADAGAVKIAGEDGLMVTGEFGVGDPVDVTGTGTRMFFNPYKSAFRAGTVFLTPWDDSNIGDYSFAGGTNTKASSVASTAFGRNAESTGQSTFSVGEYVTAESYAEAVVGMHNTDYTPTSTSSWHWSDRVFVVGNGQGSVDQSNALTILKNGNAGFGTETPDTTVHIVGQMRYVDGNQGNYKYLTSDANGNATWGPDGCFTGWESITDNTNSTIITAGDTVTIPIFRDIVVNSQLPCGIDSLWNMTDSTIIGREGDAYCISLDFTTTQNTANATEFSWFINIGGAIGAIYPTTYEQNKGSGQSKKYNKTTTVYTLDTWEANGGKIQFTTDQQITISQVRINIFRIHAARP